MNYEEKLRQVLEVPAKRARSEVLFSYVLSEPDWSRCWYVVVEDCTRTERDDLQKAMKRVIDEHRDNVWNILTVKVKVLTRGQFNKAVQAILARNAELEAELTRLREVTPDVDAAIRTLEMIRDEPGYDRELPVVDLEDP